MRYSAGSASANRPIFPETRKIGKSCEVLVIGAGVAGVHAAFSAASAKAQVMLMTSSWDRAAALGWGPRFENGQGAGRTRLEAEKQGTPGALLRRSVFYEGPTGPALVDTYQFQTLWRDSMERKPNISIFQDTCEEIEPIAAGWLVKTGWGVTIKAKTVVLAVGTFLRGRVICGAGTEAGGRPGEAGAQTLDASLAQIGVELRERTRQAGPVIDGKSIGWKQLKVMPGRAEERPPFICLGNERDPAHCLESVDKHRNHYFLRKITDNTPRTLNGEAALHDIAGLENAVIVKPGFKVTSLCVPKELVRDRDLSYVEERTLFFAGQVIAAASYAQSAHEGLVAGKAAATVSRET